MSDTPEQSKSKGMEEPDGLVLPKELADSLGELPEAKRGQILRILREEVTQFAFQGPFPPPQMLDDYERHYPGFLKTLMDRALIAQSHERDMDSLSLLQPFYYARRGQIFGFLLVIGAYVVAAWSVYYHEALVAAAFGLVGLAPIVGHFMKNQPSFLTRGVSISDQSKSPISAPAHQEKSRARKTRSRKTYT